MQLKGWRYIYCGDWEHPLDSTVTHFWNSKSNRLVDWVLGLWLLGTECYYCIIQSLEKGYPCVFQINFCLWMLLNATLPSKCFQCGGKRMLSSYLVNGYQGREISAGKVFKMQGQQMSSFTVLSSGIIFYFWEDDALSTRSMNSVIFRGQFGIHKSLNCAYFLI